MPPDLTLLCIHRNSLPGLLRLLERTKDLGCSILVVDSSGYNEHRQLKECLSSRPVEVRRLIPLGWGDAYRAYGTRRARTTEVLQVDADELPSPGLLDRVRQPLDHGAAILPRRESGGEFTHHLRWYRRDAVRFDGPSFAYPTVTGQILQLNREAFLSHLPPPEELGRRTDRWARYVWVDALERPFSRNGLHSLLSGGIRRAKGAEEERYQELAGGPLLSRPQSEIYLILEALTELFRAGHPQSAWDRYRYGRFRLHWTQGLSDAQRQWLEQVAQEVVAAGGLLRYLNLTDPDYLDELTSTFPWNLGPKEVLLRLTQARSVSGAPAGGEVWEERSDTPPWVTT